jgi:O-antigen ligase/polysaccharide polymerase Wzy-like membrane protein
MEAMSAVAAREPQEQGPFVGGRHVHLGEHIIPFVVAVAVVAVALSGGGFGPGFRAGATLVVWWVVIAGLAFSLWPRARAPRAALAAGGGLLAFTLLTALSISWAADDGRAFAEAIRAAGYLGLFVLVVVASPRGSARLWLGGLAIGLVGVAVLALGSRMQPSLFPANDLARLLPSVRTRLAYPLNYWNGLGATMSLAIVLLLWLGAHARTSLGRALGTAAIPIPGLALYLTSSRGGVVALVAGLVVLVAVGPARARLLAGGLLAGAGTAVLIVLANARSAFVDARTGAPDAASQGHEMLALLLLVVVVVAVVRRAADLPLARLRVPRPVAAASVAALLVAVVVGVAVSDPGRRIDDFKKPPAAAGPARGFVARHLASAEGNGRYQFWRTGLDAFSDEPVRGMGAGAYEAWWAQHGSLPYFIRNAHSLFVEVLAELGVLGLAAMLAFLVPAAAAGTAIRRAAPEHAAAAGAALALLACGVASAAIDWTWQLPTAFAPVVVAAAVLTGPALARREPDGVPRWGLGVAVLFAGWIAVIASALALVSEGQLSESRAAARHGDLATAAADARKAHAVEPWSDAPLLQLALVRERQGDLAGARDAVHDAIDRDPRDWQSWLVATRLATKAGDAPEARRALRRTRSLNPRSPLFSSAFP